MVFGSIFSKFEEIDFTTADDTKIKFKNNFISRLAFRILGVPHIGMRLRARKIMRNVYRGDKMLDAGCGTGIYSFSLAKKFKRIKSIDIEKEKIDYAKKVKGFGNINFSEGNLCELKADDEQFDLIICSDVLEHIEEDGKAFSELARVLSKKGMLLLTVPYNSQKNRKDYEKYGHCVPGYFEKDILKYCEDNNLKLIESEGYSYPLANIISDLNYKIVDNKILLGLLFYPLYLMAIIGDLLKKGEPDGIFFLIRKSNI